MKHYITKYRENDQLIVEAWLQFDFLRWSWCFSKRKLVINKKDGRKVYYTEEDLQKLEQYFEK